MMLLVTRATLEQVFLRFFFFMFAANHCFTVTQLLPPLVCGSSDQALCNHCCVVDTQFFVVVVFFLFFLAFLHVLYVSHKLNFIMLSSRLS